MTCNGVKVTEKTSLKKKTTAIKARAWDADREKNLSSSLATTVVALRGAKTAKKRSNAMLPTRSCLRRPKRSVKRAPRIGPTRNRGTWMAAELSQNFRLTKITFVDKSSMQVCDNDTREHLRVPVRDHRTASSLLMSGRLSIRASVPGQ